MKKTFLSFFIFSQVLFSQNILDLKSRAEVIKDLQKDRLENLLPDLMEESGIDMWVLITGAPNIPQTQYSFVKETNSENIASLS